MGVRGLGVCGRGCVLVLSAMSVCGAAAGQEQSGDVGSMLSRAREATGILHLGEYPAVRLTGESEMAGLPMSFELIFDAKGRFVERFTGAITIANGFDGATAWSHDLGGEERVLEMADRQRVIAGAGVVSGWWLHPDSGCEFEPGTDADTFRWISGSGASATMRVDAATGRPVEWSSRTAVGEGATTLSGEVKLGAMTFPALVRGDASGMSQVRITKAEAWTPTDGDFSPSVGGARDTRFDAKAASELDVTRTKTGHMLVKVTIDGQDAGYFIFDTGAGGTVISNATADRLKLERFGKLPMVGVGGTIETNMVRPRSMTVGPMTIDGPLMTTLDTEFLTKAMGVEISGIVGYGLMHRAILEVDRGLPRVALHDPRTYTNPDLKWEEMRITGRVPVAKAQFEGHEGWFRLDTGASSRFLTMHYHTVQNLKLLEGRELTDTQLGGVGGKVAGKAGKLAWFEIGGRRTEDVAVDFAIENKGSFAEEEIMGNLGGKALSGFTIFFDYQGRRIAFVRE